MPNYLKMYDRASGIREPEENRRELAPYQKRILGATQLPKEVRHNLLIEKAGKSDTDNIFNLIDSGEMSDMTMLNSGRIGIPDEEKFNRMRNDRANSWLGVSTLNRAVEKLNRLEGSAGLRDQALMKSRNGDTSSWRQIFFNQLKRAGLNPETSEE